MALAGSAAWPIVSVRGGTGFAEERRRMDGDKLLESFGVGRDVRGGVSSGVLAPRVSWPPKFLRPFVRGGASVDKKRFVGFINLCSTVGLARRRDLPSS